jgi:two-component system phosphate regulon sensor histidine kinase PhoR
VPTHKNASESNHFIRLFARSFLLLLPLIVLAIPLGMLLGERFAWALVIVGLVWQLAHHLRHFVRLSLWANQPSADKTLEGSGAWDEVFGQLYQHEKLLKARIARRDSEIERFEAAGHALTDGVIMLDAQNHIEWCNSTAEQQLGLIITTDRGQHIANLFRSPEFVAYLQAAEFANPLVLRTSRSDRVLSFQLIQFAQNRRLMQVQDVTQTDLLDRMRRDFVANVSHELRTPLTVLSGFVETLQEVQLEPEEKHRYLSMMGEQSNRMLAIVQDLLTLSSIESAPLPDNTPVDMERLLNKLVRDAQALSQGKHQIEISADYEQDICGVESELVSAFSNLVSNAVRYTPSGGTIRIFWKKVPLGIEFAVEDTGIGIEQKHIPRLTERFYRVDRGRSRDAGGTGLGLAIVKHALQRHQAQLEVNSLLGHGSRFSAIFPTQRLSR